ncbi:MAG TPA: WD40 repeat domain-containing protein [Ktedonobacteraceae bacterium]
MATGSADKTVQVWDATTGKTLLTYRGHKDKVNAIAWSPDSKLIASGSDDHTVQAWDVTTSKLLWTHLEQDSSMDDYANPVSAVAWSPDGQYVVSGSADGAISQVCFAATGKFNSQGTGPSGASLAWSPDSKRIVAACGLLSTQVWDILGNNMANEYDSSTSLDDENDSVKTVAWSPDGHYIAAGATDKTVQVWDATTYDDTTNAYHDTTTLTYQQHTASVNTIAWSPNGKYIASGSDDKTVQVWGAP